MMPRHKMSRRRFLGGVVAGTAAAIGSYALAEVTGLTPETFLPRLLGGSVEVEYNIILIVCDTLRCDHIGFYGNNWIQTPNIDAFAAQAQVFDNYYAGGYPTVLNRSETLTGRAMFPIIGWEDLPEDATVLAQVLNDSGYRTALVFDTWHFKDHGFFLDRVYQSWQWIRGQEGDRYQTNPPEVPLPADPEKFRNGADTISQYLRNMADRTTEADYLVARTMQAAIDWLQRNHTYTPFFLHVDSFDPHEPWDPPQNYVDLYDPGYTGQQVIYPAHAPPDYLTPEELNHVQALYAGEVTLVDTWVGALLNEIDALGLRDNTIVIFTSDHGILLGEHNGVGKAYSSFGHNEAYPLYQELAHVPLMVRVPGRAARRLDTLAQPVDLMPTILDYAGTPDPGTMQGYSLRPYLEGAGGSPRAITVSARSFKDPAIFPRVTVCDGEWTLIHGAAHAPSELYYLPSDPLQQNNLLGANCGQALTLHGLLIDYLESIEVPASMLDVWRPPPC